MNLIAPVQKKLILLVRLKVETLILATIGHIITMKVLWENLKKIGNLKFNYFKNNSINRRDGIVGRFEKISGKDTRLILKFTR